VGDAKQGRERGGELTGGTGVEGRLTHGPE
jgi:hypothetical protein